MTATPTIDTAAVKSRQQSAWSSGDYAAIGTTLQLVGENLCEAVDVVAGSRVLDVAAGNGNASLAAARRGCHVVATDYVPELLTRAEARAAADGVPLETRTADAEDLPFSDDSFDAVLSTFGVMFTPNQELAAAELARVCRGGGRVGLANWTPDSFVGGMFRVIGSHVAPPKGIRSPLEWGTKARLDELFDGRGTVQVTERAFVFRDVSAQAWLETFRSFYGPMLKAFEALDDTGRKSLESELLALAESQNTAKAEGLRVPSTYLEAVITITA